MQKRNVLSWTHLPFLYQSQEAPFAAHCPMGLCSSPLPVFRGVGGSGVLTSCLIEWSIIASSIMLLFKLKVKLFQARLYAFSDNKNLKKTQ